VSDVPPADAMVHVAGLRKHFQVRGAGLRARPRVVHAVTDVSFSVARGTTLGIVGESGCGKSTVARLLMGLVPADAGDVRIAGLPLQVGRQPLQALRRAVQMVFQGSHASLDPRLTVEDSLMFGPRVYGEPRPQARAHAHELLARVGLEPERYARRYPHEVSGGQRQRVNIARAGPAAAGRHLRRGGVGAGQVGRGTGSEPAARPEGRVRPDLALHLARPQRGAVHQRPGAGDVPGPGGGDQPGGRPVRPAGAPVLETGSAATLHGSMRGTRVAGIAGTPPDLAPLSPGCAFRARCGAAAGFCLRGSMRSRPGGFRCHPRPRCAGLCSSVRWPR